MKEKYLLCQILLKQLLAMEKIRKTEFEVAFNILTEKIEKTVEAVLHIYMRLRQKKRRKHSNDYRVCEIDDRFSREL